MNKMGRERWAKILLKNGMKAAEVAKTTGMSFYWCELMRRKHY